MGHNGDVSIMSCAKPYSAVSSGRPQRHNGDVSIMSCAKLYSDVASGRPQGSPASARAWSNDGSDKIDGGYGDYGGDGIDGIDGSNKIAAVE